MTLAILGLVVQQPYLTMAMTTFALFISLKLVLSTAAAACASILIPFSTIGFVEIWSPHFPAKFTLLIGFFLITEIGLAGFHHLKRNINRPGEFTTQKIFLVLATFFPGLVNIGLLFFCGNLVGPNLSWMLHGDAQTNTSALLEIISLNGFAGGLPAISQGLMAASVAGNLGFEVSTAQFVQLMQIQATDLALVWGALSVLFGLVAAKELSNNSFFIRLVGTSLGAAMPLTSFLLGFSIDAGFFNTPFALFAIVSAWIFWRETLSFSGKLFWMSPILLIITSFYALLAWAPLAVFPVFFVLVISVNQLIKSRTVKLRFAIIAALITVLAVLFFWSVVLPRVGGLSTVAAADGWMTNVPFQLVLSTLFIGLLTAVVTGLSFKRSGEASLGLFLVILATFIGVGFLFLQALDMNEPFAWRYYPRKMAWMAIFFIIFATIFVFIGSQLYLSVKRWWNRGLAIISILGLSAAAYISIPFGPKEPLRLFPLINVAVNGEDVDQTIPEIASSLGKKYIRLGYDGNDFITNQWVFQWEKYKNESPIWSYAYSTIQSPDDVCSAAGTWGGGVTLFTRDESVLIETLEKCGPLISEVMSKLD